MDMDVSRISTKRLRFRYGESNGKDREAEAELQKRGLNSKDLQQVIWDYGAIKWRAAKNVANIVACKRRRRVRRAKNKRRRLRRQERRRQKQIAQVARLKEGVVIVGQNYDISRADGSCPV
jgi:hypothetical protein